MCPNESPGLADCWGEEFENLYMRYEAEGKYRKKVKAQDLWKAIVESQIETGTPYMLYKDACNRKTNHQNLGTIKCSNLCTEIVEYSSPDEVNYNLTKYYKYFSDPKSYPHMEIDDFTCNLWRLGLHPNPSRTLELAFR